ncbi:MAG TPA: UDP-N-acetylmuramate--L-alanine ligase [Kiritimatiellia bacterium]|nr:UDP-N-acetylmuramate--L-alanine ligase [Kiritimatiellia bacterium]
MKGALEQGWGEKWRVQAEVARAWLNRRKDEVHFAGIGGVGMAGLAAHLNDAGFTVTGCDEVEGPLISWLRERGIPCAIGHDPGHLSGVTGWVVRSPAVPLDHPELVAARERGIPVIERGAVLPVWMERYEESIAVAGTHGKTTTCCMVYHVLQAVGREPAYAIGGQPYGQAGAAGGFGRDCFLAEADESDGSLALYRPRWSVITHTELDHVDFFPDADSLMKVYRELVFLTKEGVVCPAGDEGVLGKDAAGARVVTFSVEGEGDLTARDVVALKEGGQRFTLMVEGRPQGEVRLGVPGRHNVANALASLGAIYLMGCDVEAASEALGSFRLPRRRFETVVEARGIRMISDYAHHPTEIKALLEQARQLTSGRVIGVFQPHRYSRTKRFAEGFVEALDGVDELLLVPVYSASERFVEGGAIEDLGRAFERAGRGGVQVCEGLDAAWIRLHNLAREGDVVLLIGAGDVDVIGSWAKEAWL